MYVGDQDRGRKRVSTASVKHGGGFAFQPVDLDINEAVGFSQQRRRQNTSKE